MIEPFASSDPPTPDLPPQMLIRQSSATHAAGVGMAPLDAAAPDLPDFLLTAAAERQVIAGTMPSQPGPDLAESMLSPGGLPTVPVEEAVAPGIAGDLLQASADHLEGDLVGRAAFPPELMMPLAGAGLPGSELSFEKKWDDLTRRLGGSEPGGSDSALMHPPDLPAELLRPEPASGDGDDIVEVELGRR